MPASTKKAGKSKAGAKPYDPVLMFKIVILQRMHNLSDDETEYQIRDRFSFRRFLRLQLEDAVPDATTLWLFKEKLKEKHLDLVIANNLTEPGAGFGVDTNLVTLLYSNGEIIKLPMMSKIELAGTLLDKIAALII